jgi:hypothetical protein
MKTRILIVTGLFLFSSFPAFANLSQENGIFTITSKAVNWGLQFPEGDFRLKLERHSPDGLNHYYHFFSKKMELDASFTLETAERCFCSKECRDVYLKTPNPGIVNPQKVNHFDLNEFAVVEFLVPEFKGRKVNQMNFSAHYVKDGYWVDMHLSKFNYQPGQRGVLENFARSVSIRDMASIPMPFEKEADPIAPREFNVAEHGALVIDVPRSWVQYVKQASDGAPPTIVLRPRLGDEFQLLLTPLWNTNGAKGFNSAENVREFVTFSAKQLASNSVEKNLVVETIPREKGNAFYFFATDRAPKKGEYPYLIQGAIGMDDLVVSVSLLFRNKEAEAMDAVLNLFSTARKK